MSDGLIDRCRGGAFVSAATVLEPGKAGAPAKGIDAARLRAHMQTDSCADALPVAEERLICVFSVRRSGRAFLLRFYPAQPCVRWTRDHTPEDGTDVAVETAAGLRVLNPRLLGHSTPCALVKRKA